MKRKAIIAAVVLAQAASGCVGPDPRPMVATARGRWDFPIVGRLEELSLADLAAVVAAVPQTHIYLLRIVSHDKVQVEDTRFQRGTVTYQEVERVRGRWQVTGHWAEQG